MSKLLSVPFLKTGPLWKSWEHTVPRFLEEKPALGMLEICGAFTGLCATAV